MEFTRKLLLAAILALIGISAYYFLYLKPSENLNAKKHFIIVDVNIIGDGRIEHSGVLKSFEPFNVTLKAVPSGGYRFAYWEVNGSRIEGGTVLSNR